GQYQRFSQHAGGGPGRGGGELHLCGVQLHLRGPPGPAQGGGRHRQAPVPLRGHQVRQRAVRRGVLPQLRLPRHRAALLQRVRPPPGPQRRLRGGDPPLGGGDDRRRGGAHQWRWRDQPGLLLYRQRGAGQYPRRHHPCGDEPGVQRGGGGPHQPQPAVRGDPGCPWRVRRPLRQGARSRGFPPRGRAPFPGGHQPYPRCPGLPAQPRHRRRYPRGHALVPGAALSRGAPAMAGTAATPYNAGSFAHASHNPPMNPLEIRSLVGLVSLYATRMLGLFMVLPVLSLHGSDYAGSTTVLIGVALGIYGLTQGLLQIPLGMLSDRIGPKTVILAGTAMFLAGSVVAATADSVYGLIAGRALQGAGAVSSTVMALLADLTTEQNRTKAMAAVGGSIGLSFAVAMIAGPAIAATFGMGAIFWFTAALGAAGILVVLYGIPDPVAMSNLSSREALAMPELLGSTLANRELLRLDIGIF